MSRLDTLGPLNSFEALDSLRLPDARTGEAPLVLLGAAVHA